MISTQRFSALAAITCGALFTIIALLSIWGVSPFGCWGCGNGITDKLLPSLALLTVAFMVLLIIVRVMGDEKKEK